MSEKKANKSRYWVTYLVKDLQVGETFKPTARHLTIIPWFVTDKNNEEVIKSFMAKFEGQKHFGITVGPHTEFNNRRKIAINLVSPSTGLKDLHKKTLEWFSDLNARWAVKNPYVGEQYIPHIRRRVGHNLSEGESIEIISLSLVEASRRGDDLRTVIAKADLND